MNTQKLIIIISLFISSCVQEGKNKKKTTIEAPPPTVGVDPLLPYQWHLKNTGSNYLIGTVGSLSADINLGQLHEEGLTGRGITIAISDTDLQNTHADLINNFSIPLSRNYNFSSSHSRSPLSHLSEASHATVVAGFAAASMNNAIGGKGVSPEATIAGFNYLSVATTTSITVDQAKGESIDIFNYSYGYSTCALIARDLPFIAAMKSGVETQRYGKGSLYIKAAGNEYVGMRKDCTNDVDDKVMYLGNANYDPDNTSPYTILVAALDSSGLSSQFSTPGANIWVSAPGGGPQLNRSPLVSTDVMGCNYGYANNQDPDVVASFEKGTNPLNSLCDYTADASGTSFAAPIVSGVVALMLQANPTLKWRDVKHILAKTAIPVGGYGAFAHPIAASNLSGHAYDLGMVQNNQGYSYSNYYGFGRVDAQAAANMAANYNTNLGEFINFKVDSGSIDLDIPDNSATGVEYSLHNPNHLYVESIELNITTTGSKVSDLGIELTSPSGTRVTITNINSNNIAEDFQNTTLLANAFYREAALGPWKIKVIDGKGSLNPTSKLNSVSLTFYGTTNGI